MDIYSLRREEGANPDEADAFVVVAPTGHEARRLAALGAGDEGAFPWAFEAKLFKVGTAEPGIEPGVLLRSFRAG